MHFVRYIFCKGLTCTIHKCCLLSACVHAQAGLSACVHAQAGLSACVHAQAGALAGSFVRNESLVPQGIFSCASAIHLIGRPYARLRLPFTHKSRHRTLAHGSDQGAVCSQWLFHWQAPQRGYGPCARVLFGPVCVRTRTGRRAARRPSAALHSLAMEQPFLQERALHMTTGRLAVARLVGKG